MWNKYKDVDDVCFCIQTDDYTDWDWCPEDPTDQYEAMRMAWQEPDGKVIVLENASDSPVCIDVIDRGSMWDKEFVLIEDEQCRVFDSEKAAKAAAKSQQSHVVLAYWDDEKQKIVEVIEHY